MLFLLILAISIVSAIGQIISTSFDLKNPLKKGVSQITIAGWIFYICAGVLAFMPAIQKAFQDGIDNDKEIQRTNEQEERYAKLKNSYDSSLTEMKKKFDTTTSIVSETLAKYGYKLDATNRELINIKDSVRTMSGGDPVLNLSFPPDDPGIMLMEELSGNKYKFRINLQSRDAGSSFFDIVYSFVVSDSLYSYYVKPESNRPVEYSTKFSIDQIVGSYNTLDVPHKNLTALFLWIRGSYKRLDGTGNFSVNDVYGYYFKNKRIMTIKGGTKKLVISIVNANEK